MASFVHYELLAFFEEEMWSDLFIKSWLFIEEL
jgi:hypothetical protein